MSRHPLHRRMEQLESVLTAKLNKPLPFWMQDAEQDPGEFIDKLIAAGEVRERDRRRVFIIRWMKRAEAEAADRIQPPAPAPAPARIRLINQP